MKKTKKVLIAAYCLIVFGVLFWGVGKWMGGSSGFYVDASGIHTTAGDKKTQEPRILEKTEVDVFDSLKISAESADIEIIPSDGYYMEYRIVGGESDPKYKVDGNKLIFSENPAHHFFFTYFDFSIPGLSEEERSYIKLYVPADKVLNTVELLNEDGNITLSDMQADNTILKNTGGNITVGKVKASKCNINLEDGALTLEELNADNIKIENEYGDINGQTLQGSKGEITMKDGDLKIDTVSVERFSLNNDYGDAKILALNSDKADIYMEDGDFEAGADKISLLQVENEYGNVTLNLANALEQYAVDLYSEYGSILLPDNSTINNHSDEVSYVSKNKSANKIKVTCDDGKIVLKHKTAQ